MCYFVFYTYKKLYYYSFFPTFTTIHTTNTIATNSFSLRLFNSFITDFSLENEHTTDFTSVLGKTLNTNSTDSCNCSNLAYFIDGIVVTCLVINNYVEHLQKKTYTTVHNTYTTYSITNISCSLLCSSSTTSCTFDLEHTTPFVSIVGVKPIQRQSVISCTSINDVTIHIIGLFLFIIIYRLVINYCTEHLQESVTRLTSARLVEHLIEVRCSL